jgi:hypothetical protein
MMMMIMMTMMMMMLMLLLFVSVEHRPGWTVHMFDHTKRISSDKNM